MTDPDLSPSDTYIWGIRVLPGMDWNDLIRIREERIAAREAKIKSILTWPFRRVTAFVLGRPS